MSQSSNTEQESKFAQFGAWLNDFDEIEASEGELPADDAGPDHQFREESIVGAEIEDAGIYQQGYGGQEPFSLDEMVQDLDQQPMPLSSGSFLGLLERRNAPNNLGDGGWDNSFMDYDQGLYGGMIDATLGDLDREATPVPGPSSRTQFQLVSEAAGQVGPVFGLAGQPSQSGASSSALPSTTGQSSNGTFACDHPGCDAVYSKWYKLNHHRRKHILKAHWRFVCPLCPAIRNKRFQYLKDLNKHLRSSRHSQPGFRCDDCGRPYTRSDNLKRHQERAGHGIYTMQSG